MNSVQVEALIALELFQLDPRSKQSKALLHQYLVEVSLLETTTSLTTSQVMEKVTEMCGRRAPLSNEQIQAALKVCVDTNTVLHDSEGKYLLSQTARESLEEEKTKYKKQENGFRRLIIEHVERSLNQTISTLSEPVLVASVTRTLQALFYDHHIRLQSVLDEGKNLSCLLESEFDAEKYLRQQLGTFVTTYAPGGLENVVFGVKDALASMSQDDQGYLLGMLQQIFFFEILNLDPRLQDLEKRCFEQTRLYLDTNVGIRYISVHHPHYETIAFALDTSRKLGCQLCISPITLVEMAKLVEHAKRHSTFLNQDKILKAFAVDPRAADNPIIEAYVSEKSKNPSLIWGAFISRYDDIKTVLLAREVFLSGDEPTDLKSHPSYLDVEKAVKQNKPIAVNQENILHDTINILLVHKERQKINANAMGPGVWLITEDHSLPRVDKSLLRIFKVGHCRMMDQWAETIFPFQGIAGTSFSSDYIAFLLNNRFGMYLNRVVIKTEFLQTLVNDQIGVPELLGLPPEVVLGVVRTMQEDRESNKIMQQSAEVGIDEAEMERRRKRLRDFVSKKAAEIEADHRKKLDMETKRLKDGITELQSILDQAMQKSEKDTLLIKTLQEKITHLGLTVIEKEGALQDTESILEKTKQQLEFEKNVAWWTKLWRNLNNSHRK